MTQLSDDVLGTQAGTADLTEDEHYCVLASEQRRLALVVLTERTAPVSVRDLAKAVAVRTSEIDADDGEAVEKVAIKLHHAHLPRMAELGVIDYDSDANRIESCPPRPDS